MSLLGDEQDVGTVSACTRSLLVVSLGVLQAKDELFSSPTTAARESLHRTVSTPFWVYP